MGAGDWVASGSFWLVVGGLLLLTSLVGLGTRLLFVAGAQRTGATVVRWSSGRSPSMFVQLDGGGQARVIHAGRWSLPVGQRLEVLANPARPGRVMRPGTWDLVGPAIVGSSIGACMLIAGVLLDR